MTNNLPQDPMRLDLIPGTLCDERLWSPLVSKLGEAYVCNYIPLQQAGTRQQMQELIASHSAAQSHLVGFSLGAYLAIEHAVAHPERIKSLTLIANSAKGLLAAEIEARERIVNMLKRNAYAGITRQRLRELLHPSHLQDQSITGVIEQMGLDLGKDVLLTQFSTTINRPDLMDRLPAFSFPVLIVGAEEDQLVPAADLRAMAERLPHATLHMVRGASGHMIPLEQPEELAAAMHAHFGAFGALPQFQG